MAKKTKIKSVKKERTDHKEPGRLRKSELSLRDASIGDLMYRLGEIGTPMGINRGNLQRDIATRLFEYSLSSDSATNLRVNDLDLMAHYIEKYLHERYALIDKTKSYKCA